MLDSPRNCLNPILVFISEHVLDELSSVGVDSMVAAAAARLTSIEGASWDLLR